MTRRANGRGDRRGAVFASLVLSCVPACGRVGFVPVEHDAADAPVAPSLGLIAHWKFDESGATTTAADASPTASTGTLAGFADPSAAWQPSGGRIGGALEFAGDDDVVSVEGSAVAGHVLDLTTGAFTIAMWTRPDAVNGTLVARRDNAGDQFQFLLGADPRLVLRAGGEYGSGNTVIPFGVWSHVAVVVDASGSPELYVNGEKETWGDENGSRPYSITHVDVELSVGARYTTGTTTSFPYDGMLDDVRIYGRALSDQEVHDIFAAAGT